MSFSVYSLNVFFCFILFVLYYAEFIELHPLLMQCFVGCVCRVNLCNRQSVLYICAVASVLCYIVY